MTNQQILEKAIAKAMSNGWKEEGIQWLWKLNELADIADFDMTNPNNLAVLVYNHDFAKSFFGDDFPMKDFKGRGSGWSIWEDGKLRDLKYWEKNLMDMVISKDPIKFLEKFL